MPRLSARSPGGGRVEGPVNAAAASSSAASGPIMPLNMWALSQRTASAATAAKPGVSAASAATRPWCAARCGSVADVRAAGSGAVTPFAAPPAVELRAIASSLQCDAEAGS